MARLTEAQRAQRMAMRNTRGINNLNETISRSISERTESTVVGGSLQWVDYVSSWDTQPVEISSGVWSYIWLGVTRYRTVPTPYLASGDAFYSDAGLTTLIVARGQ